MLYRSASALWLLCELAYEVGEKELRQAEIALKRVFSGGWGIR